MDSWLTNEVKQLLSQPCLAISSVIAKKLNNRIKVIKQNMDERSLTEYLVDALDTSSLENVWGSVLELLRDQNIYLQTNVRKSTKENKTGADIGLIINREISQQNKIQSIIRYSCLIQCKRVDINGEIGDFYHEVSSTKKTQSSLMLDITPSAFYFIFTPSCLLDIDYSLVPVAFIDAGGECKSPIWNMGHFGCNKVWFPFLSNDHIDSTTGVLVVPALAVEAQNNKGKDAKLKDILPNCMPFWYWFSEILVAGFVGDSRQEVIHTASNAVNFSVEISIGNG